MPTKGDIVSNLHIANPNSFHLLIIDFLPLKVSDIASITVTRKERKYEGQRRKNNNTSQFKMKHHHRHQLLSESELLKP